VSQNCSHTRIDVFFHFEYHPLGFPKGVQGMLRTSRCYAGRFFQLGGPEALFSVARHPYQFCFADFSFAPTQALVSNAICQSGLQWFATTPWSTEHNLRKRENLAAQFAAIIG
jgi:hypothetical protein